MQHRQMRAIDSAIVTHYILEFCWLIYTEPSILSIPASNIDKASELYDYSIKEFENRLHNYKEKEF